MNLMKIEVWEPLGLMASFSLYQQSWDQCFLTESVMLPQEARKDKRKSKTRATRKEKEGRKEGEIGRFVRLEWKRPNSKRAHCSLSKNLTFGKYLASISILHSTLTVCCLTDLGKDYGRENRAKSVCKFLASEHWNYSLNLSNILQHGGSEEHGLWTVTLDTNVSYGKMTQGR